MKSLRDNSVSSSGHLLCWILLVFPAVVFGDELTPKQTQFFEAKIRPVLVKHCYKCHSTKTGKTEGALALDTRSGIREGGDSGHAVVPGDIENSLIINALNHESFEMPPERKLSGKVVKDFEAWIRMGAPDPRDGKSIVKNRSTIDFEKGKEFWAFAELKPAFLPNLDSEWAVSEIDQFVLEKLNDAKIRPAKPATESQLLRRDYVNLTGLPPTSDELADYLADESPDKRERLIDKLLRSPRFGERWGRHWLDIARFAESNGRERNFLFPHAWRYRNYVIDSFNSDKPFDRFVKEQLAGDLMDPLVGQDQQELKVATGFLAVGPKLLNEGNREVFAMDLLDEQMDVVFRSTMALTVTCARCHDHKFDPISTEDYYSLAGVFRSTQTLFGKGGNGSRQATPLISLEVDENAAATSKKQHDERIAQLTAQIKTTNARIKDSSRQPGKRKQKGGKRQKASQPKVESKKGGKLTNEQLDRLRRRLRTLQQELRQLRQSGPNSGKMAMGAREGKCVDCNVLIRGEVSSRGKKVPRGFLTVLGNGQRQLVRNKNLSGREELANWIVSSDNPLTARVTVNRIWRHLFGEGLVRTVDNFGVSGEKPSHPELLDYLANRLITNQWSFKKTIKEILLSQTYQMSHEHVADNYRIDPDNRLIWRMNARRMDAEVMRDSLLLASNELKLDPPKSSPVARFKSSQGIGRGITEETFEAESFRRSVYLPVVRNAVPEPLRVFDFAEPSILVGNRQVTTVPTQALYMMNSEFVMKRSAKLAERLIRPGKQLETQLVDAYKIVLSREPSSQEFQRGSRFINDTKEKLVSKNRNSTDAERLALAAFCQALFASGEFRILN